MDEKRSFLKLIQSNIKQFGYHLTIVKGAIEPRFAYTIGLSPLLGFELAFAGGVYYLEDDVNHIIAKIVEGLKNRTVIEDQIIEVGVLGTFKLSKIHSSWSKLMLLGVFDYYETNKVSAYQILPDLNHKTLDIPDMSVKWDPDLEPVWQWLVKSWDYPVPSSSTVVTNVDALQGEAITEIMRWDTDEWEMFAGSGPDVAKRDIRVVSLGTILGIDKTVQPSIDLNVNKGLWRESADSKWNDWG